jgi:hypothetical protein
MGGGFNCVLKRDDTTGNFNYSRAVDALVEGMDLHDAWQGGTNRQEYTYYSISGAARLDRKQGMETLAAAFKVHLPVCLRLSVVEAIMRRDPGYWKKDARILEDKTDFEQLKSYGTNSEDKRRFFLIPRYGGRDPANGGYKVSFAKYRRKA